MSRTESSAQPKPFKCLVCGDVYEGEWCPTCGEYREQGTVLITPAPTKTIWVCRCRDHHWDERPRHVVCAQCEGAIREVEEGS